LKETLAVTFIKRSYIIFVVQMFLAVLWIAGPALIGRAPWCLSGDKNGCEVLVDSKNVT
jgi:hypothetical protein